MANFIIEVPAVKREDYTLRIKTNQKQRFKPTLVYTLSNCN